MAALKPFPIIFFVSFCLFSNGIKSTDSAPSQPILIVTSKIKPEQANVEKGQTENKAVWIPEDRKAGTITFKPLMVNFTALTIGMTKKNQVINGFAVNAYRSAFGYMANRTDRAGIGYDLELGIMATNDIEIFTILGISHESPFKKITVMYPPFTPPFNQNNAAFDFKPRDSFELSLGGRYYWNTQKPWFPFVGIMGTATFQGPVKADVFRQINPILKSYAPVGPLTLQERKTLLGGTFLAGADYQFNKYAALTLSVGLRYSPRTSTTYTSINGIPVSFRDNSNLWSLPILAALKFTF